MAERVALAARGEEDEIHQHLIGMGGDGDELLASRQHFHGFHISPFWSGGSLPAYMSPSQHILSPNGLFTRWITASSFSI